jgi:D-alanyl-D-alanine dipeptidase
MGNQMKIPGQKRVELVEPIRELDKIVIKDNGEPMIDVFKNIKGLDQMELTHLENPKPHRFFARQRICEMLEVAQKFLPKGYGLRISNIYRSVEEQQEMYKNAYDKQKEGNPNWPENILRRQTNRWVHPPDAKTPPGHSTGGCVDLGIRGPDGEALDMISPFDWEDDDRAKALHTFSPHIDASAIKNRALLIKVMSKAGFSNYAGEFWHWSYGDSCWAWRQMRKTAIYDSVPPPK